MLSFLADEQFPVEQEVYEHRRRAAAPTDSLAAICNSVQVNAVFVRKVEHKMSISPYVLFSY